VKKEHSYREERKGRIKEDRKTKIYRRKKKGKKGMIREGKIKKNNV
jgi:hypothetical protein